MSITYSYKVNLLESYPTYEGHENVVCKVTWAYRGVDANGVSSTRIGVQEVTFEKGAPFTPYSDLTETQVLSWVTPNISAEQQAEMEAAIAGDIDWQIQQASANDPVAPPLPWPTAPVVAD